MSLSLSRSERFGIGGRSGNLLAATHVAPLVDGSSGHFPDEPEDEIPAGDYCASSMVKPTFKVT
jgi:hypothetical protein